MPPQNSLSSNCVLSSFICVFAKHDYGQGAVLYLGTLPGNDLVLLQSSLHGGSAAGVDRAWALSPSCLAGGKAQCSPRYWRRIKPLYGSYVLYYYLCESSMVVTYCTTIYVRGKSITILQHMEETKSSWDHLSYTGHVTSRVTLTPDADHSICLSCQVFALTWHVNHKPWVTQSEGRTMRWRLGEQQLFSSPLRALHFSTLPTFLPAQGCSPAAWRAAQSLSPLSPSAICMVGCWNAMKTSGLQWLLGESCKQINVVSLLLCISQELKSTLQEMADLSVEEGAPQGKGTRWSPKSNAVLGTIALAPEIIALYMIIYLVNQRVLS